ncbi:MAG: hypothetical protein HS113_05845 [Verrucomicrobiales bacterium]|nr:hypothetical protein [Verrucomicrobiales bacterium]
MSTAAEQLRTELGRLTQSERAALARFLIESPPVKVTWMLIRVGRGA